MSPPGHLKNFVLPLDAELKATITAQGLTLSFDPLLQLTSNTHASPAAEATNINPQSTYSLSSALNPSLVTVGDPTLTISNDVTATSSTGACILPSLSRTCVVMCSNMVTAAELEDDDDYEDIVMDIEEECGKFGKLQRALIPRKEKGVDRPSPGVGYVFLHYSDLEGAQRAKDSLSGRVFGGKTIITAFFDEEKFNSGQLV